MHDTDTALSSRRGSPQNSFFFAPRQMLPTRACAIKYSAKRLLAKIPFPSFCAVSMTTYAIPLMCLQIRIAKKSIQTFKRGFGIRSDFSWLVFFFFEALQVQPDINSKEPRIVGKNQDYRVTGEPACKGPTGRPDRMTHRKWRESKQQLM